VDQPPSKPSFDDDPNFLANLSNLDSGMLEGGDEISTPNPSAALRMPDQRANRDEPSDLSIDLGEFAFPEADEESAEGPPPSQSPHRRHAAAAAPPRPPAVVLPAIVPAPPGGRRPLLDLFPPPPGGVPVPPALELGPASPQEISARSPAQPGPAQPAPAQPGSAPPITYEPFYGLAEKPFTLSTDPKFLYHSVAHDAAAQDLLSAIRRRDGLVVLTGQIGIGKTTLCRAVSEELDRRTLTSIVVDPFVSVEALLQTVLVDFGVISRDDVARGLLARASGTDLFAKLREFLASLVQLEAFAVVIIDEAQNVPPSVLQEILALMDLDADQHLLQIALVGQPSLLKLLARGELRPLQERVAVRSELRALAGDEIAGYLMHRLLVAGMQRPVDFDDRALTRLYQVSAGIPRIVNLVCDRALALGYNASARVIDETLILTAAHDLDVLPHERPKSQVWHRAVAAVAVIGLMGSGAIAAAWVFRAPLSRIVRHWSQVPPSPPAPVQQLPPTLLPPSPPAGATAPAVSPR
jgi:type II secretory pathway predicted ATPase ExeA